jgi:hypothetical protein
MGQRMGQQSSCAATRLSRVAPAARRPAGDPAARRRRPRPRDRAPVQGGGSVSSTPTGPAFRAALDSPHAALVTILAALDANAAPNASGGIPEIPGLAVPDGATH